MFETHLMVREIITAEQGVVQIRLPDDFIGKLVEIIAFPISDIAETTQRSLPIKRITVVNLKNKSFMFNRDELYDR